MSRERVVQRYFDAWNAHDAAAIVATFAEGGTYADPITPGPLSGDAIAENARRLWSAFPDVTFEIRGRSSSSDGVIAAEWIMKGTNTGPFGELPPSGRRVVLEGADFIRVEETGILSVRGYFDAGTIPRQLGLQVLVQPESADPFTFGSSARVAGRSTAVPGAFSITALCARSAADAERVRSYSRAVAADLPRLKGFMGWVGTAVGDRMLTVTAWQSPEDPRQLLAEGPHAEAMRAFFGPDLAAGGWTGIWVPHRINALWARCTACGKMATRDPVQEHCACGADLGPVPSYW